MLLVPDQPGRAQLDLLGVGEEALAVMLLLLLQLLLLLSEGGGGTGGDGGGMALRSAGAYSGAGVAGAAVRRRVGPFSSS